MMQKYLTSYPLFVVVGGDGTVQSVVESLYNMKDVAHKPPVSFINNYAN